MKRAKVNFINESVVYNELSELYFMHSVLLFLFVFITDVVVWVGLSLLTLVWLIIILFQIYRDTWQNYRHPMPTPSTSWKKRGTCCLFSTRLTRITRQRWKKKNIGQTEIRQLTLHVIVQYLKITVGCTCPAVLFTFTLRSKLVVRFNVTPDSLFFSVQACAVWSEDCLNVIGYM